MSVFDNWNLPPGVRENLEKAGLISSETILECSNNDLQKIGNLTKEECSLIRSCASKSILPSGFKRAANIGMEEKWRHLSVGCRKLDEFLRGGIAVRGVTEIAGESSSGKTQLCLQMCLTVQYSVQYGGLRGGAVFICTEDAFPSRRLQELIHSFPSTFCESLPDTKFGDNIFIEHIGDVENLKHCLLVRLPQLLVQRNVKLVVVDSIAGAFRAEYEPGDAISRARDFQELGSHLHKLAGRHHIAVICVNQVSDVISDDGAKHQPVPTLGLAWANMVTTRLQLSRTSRIIPDPCNPSLESPVRKMEVLFSPNLPCDTCHFIVTGSGVMGIS